MTPRIPASLAIAARAALLAALAGPLAALPAWGDGGTQEPLPELAYGEATAPVMLNGQVVVGERLVRLGDLFANVPADKAEIPVAYAPEPGREAILDARWLYRVAHHYGIDWRPLSAKEQAVVVRDSITVGRTEIEDHVRAALVERGADPSVGIELANRLMTLHLPAEASNRIAVDDIYHDPRSGRFTAMITAPAGSPQAERVRVTGKVFRTVEVPVIASRLLPGDVIDRTDIEWIEVRADDLQRDALVDAADLIGRTPTRGLAAGQPVRSRDVRDPLLVERGQLVTIYHRHPLMTLAVQGKALQNGSKGDVVRVQNTRSNTVLEATVSGAGRVVVQPAEQLAMTPARGG